MNEQLWWYVARAGGLLAWAMITLSVIWGLTLSTRLAGKKATPGWLLDLHTFFGAGSVVFTAVHVAGLWLDSYVEFTIADFLVPMASEWKPGPVAWGVVSLYLVVAIQLTSWFKKRLPNRLWRRVHMLSFPLFAFAMIHTLWSGTDVQNPLYKWGSLVAIQTVAFLAIARVLLDRRNRRNSRPRPTRDSPKEPATSRAASTENAAPRAASTENAAPRAASTENAAPRSASTETGSSDEVRIPAALKERAERARRARGNVSTN